MASKLRRAGFALIVTLVLLGVLEGVARSLAPPLPGPGEQPQEDAMLPSELLGWAPVQGQSTAFGVPAPTFINSMGIRSPEPEPGAPDELRLLTLGDSTVYGVLVRDEDVFSAVAARRLGEELGRPVRAFNGGIPGYSSEQAWRLLRYPLQDLDFDLLVVATLWSDCQPAPEPDTVTIPIRLAKLRRAVLGSGLFRLVDGWINGPRGPEQIGWELGDEPGGRRVPLDRYRANLARLADMARDRDAEPVFLMLPSDRDLKRQPLEDPRPAYRDAMRAVAADEGALLIDGFSPFVGREPGLMLDDVHPSAQGHALLGATLAEALLPTLQ
jgi:lysophospholipase L1-like esterase